MGTRLAALPLALLLGTTLAGCAAGATAAGMTVPEAEIVRPTSKAMERSVEVGAVGGGRETNPAWTSQVGNKEFGEALAASLKLAGLLAEGQGRYVLTTVLVKLEQPFIGLDMTVTATVQYTVTDRRSGAVVWTEQVVTPFTATMGDAFVGSTRLKLANEGAVRKNIAQLVAKLGAAALPGPVAVN
ncbi:MAG: hypothetical protein NDI82_08820 [Anaeromyxobacteraceae bacterium]|nr:hypothetical protein [Anaeromyxobacteraceae bacterium]